MTNTFKSHLIGLLFLPVFSFAADSSADLSKEVWLEELRESAPVPICKSFIEDASIIAQMKARNITYEKCVSLIPGITLKCEKKYSANLPSTINDEHAEKWGRVIGECIGNDFAMSYLYSDGFSPVP